MSSDHSFSWQKSWPGMSGFSSSFPRSFPGMIRRLGPAALKITLFKMEEDKISLTVAGRYACRWTWKDEKWQQSCTCQSKESLCLHSYMLVLEVDKALGINSTKRVMPPPGFKDGVLPRPAANRTQPRLNMGPPVKQKTFTPKILEKWKLTVEIERHYSDSQAAVRFYQDFPNDRKLCVMQDLYNFSAQCYNKRGIAPEMEELDRKFLTWLFIQIKPYHIYRSREKLLKITRKKLDEWLEKWKEYPGRFIDRLTSQAVLSHCEFRAFIEPEISGNKVRLQCFLGPNREQAQPFHIYVDKFKDGKTLALAGGNIPFKCPVPMKVLLHCFKSSKVPTIPLDQAGKFLPELLQGHTEILSGDFVLHQGEKVAPLNARIEGQKLIISQKLKLNKLQLQNNKFIISGSLPNPQFEELEEKLQGQKLNSDEFSLTLNRGVLDKFFANWNMTYKMDASLRSLQNSQEVQQRFSLVDNNDGSQRLQLHWQVGGRSLSASDLQQAATSSESFFRSSDGSWFHIDKDQLQDRFGMLEDYGISPAGSPRLHPLNIAKLPLDELPPSPSSREALDQILKRFEDKELPEAKVNCELRKYQLQGYQFLSSLGNSSCGALLADDMGLGKTVQTLAALSHSNKKNLIICPSSLVHNWQREAERFTPHLQIHAIQGNLDKRSQVYDNFDQRNGLFIISYALMRNDVNTLKKLKFESIVLDEAQHIKNADSQVSRAVRQLKAEKRTALSGTPLENSPDDLWSIMEFLNPGLNGPREEFRMLCQGADASAVIKRLRPFMLRRTKQMAAPELPPKSFIPMDIPMSELQQDLYNCELRKAREAAKSGNSVNILASLTRLRQLSCHSAFGVPESSQPDPNLALSQRSPKAAAFIEKARDLMSEGHSCLFFSQFTGILKEVEKELHKENIPTHMITGETPVAKRPAIVDEFTERHDPSVFLLSLKAAGTGLNLTRASYVFIFDPWWNPAAENQAIDRSHRIGQENPVIIYRMISSHSVEEKVATLQAEKQKLFDEIIEQEDFKGSDKLKVADLTALLD